MGEEGKEIQLGVRPEMVAATYQGRQCDAWMVEDGDLGRTKKRLVMAGKDTGGEDGRAWRLDWSDPTGGETQYNPAVSGHVLWLKGTGNGWYQARLNAVAGVDGCVYMSGVNPMLGEVGDPTTQVQNIGRDNFLAVGGMGERLRAVMVAVEEVGGQPAFTGKAAEVLQSLRSLTG